MDRENSLSSALEDFKDGQFKSIRAAANYHKVSPATLACRAKGSASAQKANELRKACTPAEEQAILAWIQRCQKQGFPPRHDLLKAMAEYVIAKRNNTHQRDTLCSSSKHDWVPRFVRNKACTKENFEKWLNIYREATTTYGNNVSNIYNVDETGFHMGDAAKSYIIIDKRMGTTGYVGRGFKTENITTIECGCMDGSILPLFIIFKGKNLQSSWYAEDAPDDWMAVTSEKGWTSDLLGLAWLKRVFDPHTCTKANGRHRILIRNS